MLTQDNLADLLNTLGFEKKGAIHRKLFGAAILEHVGKTGLFDLDGDYCFASYLVRVVPDTGKVLPKFLEKMMNSSVFQTEAKGKASKSINQANINATVMRNIKVPVPTLAEQKKFVAKIEALEKQISEAQAVIDGAAARKQAILQKYL
jgi:type I restriction enzyme M protein